MITPDTYKQIQKLKSLHYRKSTIAKHLNISRTTLDKFWNISATEFSDLFQQYNRLSAITRYEKFILNLCYQNKKLSAKKICQQLFTTYGIPFSERTMSRYLKELRQRYWWYFNPTS